jgi:hypothetical protein
LSISFRAWLICSGVSFTFRPKLHTSTLRCLHPGAGALGNEAFFQLG